MPSFTQRIPNLQQIGPVIELLITPSFPFLQEMKIAPSVAKTMKILAMIDTGATGTVIQQGIPKQLGINPVGTVLINTPTSTNVLCYRYNLQLILPKDINISSIVVTETALQGQHIQCLIGRDILEKGVFIYTGYDNSFTLSF